MKAELIQNLSSRRRGTKRGKSVSGLETDMTESSSDCVNEILKQPEYLKVDVDIRFSF